MKITIDESDWGKIYDALRQTQKFHEHRDRMNAELHLAKEVRWSPLTSVLHAELQRMQDIFTDHMRKVE